MQLVFRLGTLGNENFGVLVLWNQDYCPLAQHCGARRRRRRRHMGCLFNHAFVEAHAGYTAAATAAAASPYKQIICYKTCLLSHTQRRRIFDFRRSCFCPQVVTNNRLLLLVVGCWGQKESVLTCYDMTPLLLLPPPF